MKKTYSFTSLKLLTLAAVLSTATLADAQERTRTPTDAAGAATTESTRGVAAANGDHDKAQQNANATAPKAMKTDGQILQIVRTLNDAEIKQAKYALDNADNTQVKVVAQSILNDHEDANKKVDNLLKGDLNLADSPLNDTIAKQAEATFEMLDELEDAQLDCRYLQKQAEQHEMALDTIKNDLAPDAKNAEVKAFLTATAPTLEHHMHAAQDAMKGLNGCSASVSKN